MDTAIPANTTDVSNQSPSTQLAPGFRQPADVASSNPTVVSPTTSLRTSGSWQTIRSSLSLSEKSSANLGWVTALLSVVFTVVALSPTFKSTAISEKSLRLAEWTALKDFIEECREELAAGIQSQSCLRAVEAQLPPPPYVKTGILDKRRRRVQYRLSNNGTTTRSHIELNETGIPISPMWYIGPGILLLMYLLVILKPYNLRTSLLYRRNTHQALSVEKHKLAVCDAPQQKAEIATATIVRHPPSAKEPLPRRRIVRTHPIFRHANLEEAIRDQDLPEIRLRLQNGEDVNEHWPYLIYKLAISPPSAQTPKNLEVARLCLDFGADVNALKGWNGQSALMIAIHFGNVDVAKLLIANGALVSYSASDSNQTALHRCTRLAVSGSTADALEIMELLFRRGANPNQADRIGETPLHKLLIDAWLRRDDLVCMKKLGPVALYLVEHGARMPDTLEEKYVFGNPVWKLVHGAILKKS